MPIPFKPLIPSEIHPHFHKFVNFNVQYPKQFKRQRYQCVEVTCPDCNRKRMVNISNIRNRGDNWTALCRSCKGRDQRKYLTPDEVSPQWREYFHYSSQFAKDGHLHITKICPDCGTRNQTLVSTVRRLHIFPHCPDCIRHNIYHKKHRGRWHSKGYTYLGFYGLSDTDRALASQMTNYDFIPEHRLVMATHLDRPLTKDEVVHHRNGTKDDNRIENLLLLTKNTHHVGHGHPYYQQWQEAESRIKKLEVQLDQLRLQLQDRNPNNEH